ncbi:MAG: lysophospholipid acyltransferase family protein [Candidatus Brocadiia bacterium]
MRGRIVPGLLSFLLFVLSLMPKGMCVAVCKGMAGLWYAMDRKHRRKVLFDIDRTPLAKLSAKEKVKICRGMYRHLGIMLAEISKFRSWPAERVKECLHVPDVERLRQVAGQGGCIFITAHFGNWELSGMAAPLHGIPLAALARPLKDSSIDAMLNRGRERFGQKILVKFNAMLEVVRALRSGYNMGLLIDQDAERECIFVPFLGENAGTLIVPAKLACRLGVPVYCMMAHRVAPFKHEVKVIGPLTLPTGDDAVRETAIMFNEVIGAEIMEHPEQWLWLHHRWKTADRRGLTSASGYNKDMKTG